MFADQRTIGSILSLRRSVQSWPAMAVGIEVEVEGHEGIGLTRDARRYWTNVGDSSLRDGGMEYILTEPVEDYDDALLALSNFFDRSPPTISERCSIHVHLNFLECAEEEIITFILLYTAFERILDLISGNRGTSTYCVSIGESISSYRSLVNSIQSAMMSGGHYVLGANPDRGSDARYACLSTVRLPELGSIEIRTHEGTADMDRVGRWVDILQALKAAALGRTTSEVLEALNEEPQEIFDAVFEGELGQYIQDYMAERSGGLDNAELIHDHLRKGYYTAVSLVHRPVFGEHDIKRATWPATNRRSG